MAHKKGVGSSKNGRESHSKRLGIKKFGDQAVKAGIAYTVLPIGQGNLISNPCSSASS